MESRLNVGVPKGSVTPKQPFETDLRKRASPARSAAQWRRSADNTC